MRGRAAFLLTATALLPLVTGTPLGATTLENVYGEVLVDRGGGFDPAPGPTALNPGNTVIANPGSSAVIVYSADCTVPVQPGAVIGVLDSPPCGSNGASSTGGSSSFSTSTLLIGGAVAGLAAGAAILLTSGDDDSPASP